VRVVKQNPKAKPATPTLESIALKKEPTGIYGLDDITNGGLPKGRPTLICGGAGSGKTMFAMEFLVRGALRYDQPGVLMSFEETESELVKNFASLGYNLAELQAQNKVAIDYVSINKTEIQETGEYDLEGLFVRLQYAIDSIGAKRVVLDTLEALFGGLTDSGVLRAEMRRLFQWLKDKGVTAIITAERGEGGLTRHGIEEYVSDCVLLLDNRVENDLSTRRLRILKYRGSAHGADEYAFAIDSQGITIMPVSSLRLDHDAPEEIVSSGVAQLDEMLGGGYYKGSSVLITGMAGTGKSSLGASMVDAAARLGEKSMLFSSEESPKQVVRNMRRIGLNLAPALEKDLIRIHSTRPSVQGLEMHLLVMQRMITEFDPAIVVVDALTDFTDLGSMHQVKGMVNRLVDFLKSKNITSVFLGLVATNAAEESGVGVSSTMDSWVHLTNVQSNQERNRALYILKSRGMAHSNQMREFRMTDGGVRLEEIYVGAGGALMGAARVAQEAADKEVIAERQQNIQRKKRELEAKRILLESRIAAIKAEQEAEEIILTKSIQEDEAIVKSAAAGVKSVSKQREGGNRNHTTN
jgi:circadian clock protein KaiC